MKLNGVTIVDWKKIHPLGLRWNPGKFWTGRKDTACCLLLEAGGANGSGDVGVHRVVRGIETGVEAGARRADASRSCFNWIGWWCSNLLEVDLSCVHVPFWNDHLIFFSGVIHVMVGRSVQLARQNFRTGWLPKEVPVLLPLDLRALALKGPHVFCGLEW